MEGFLILDYWEHAGEVINELAQWYQERKVKYRVHIVKGLQNAPTAMNMFFNRRNQGKLIIKL